MIQCRDCEFYEILANGMWKMNCKLTGDMKETECILKQVAAGINSIAHGVMEQSERTKPLIEGMRKQCEDINDGDKWKEASND